MFYLRKLLVSGSLVLDTLSSACDKEKQNHTEVTKKQQTQKKLTKKHNLNN